jgi:hypothetical protein
MVRTRQDWNRDTLVGHKSGKTGIRQDWNRDTLVGHKSGYGLKRDVSMVHWRKAGGIGAALEGERRWRRVSEAAGAAGIQELRATDGA